MMKLEFSKTDSTVMTHSVGVLCGILVYVIAHWLTDAVTWRYSLSAMHSYIVIIGIIYWFPSLWPRSARMSLFACVLLIGISILFYWIIRSDPEFYSEDRSYFFVFWFFE